MEQYVHLYTKYRILSMIMLLFPLHLLYIAFLDKLAGQGEQTSTRALLPYFPAIVQNEELDLLNSIRLQFHVPRSSRSIVCIQPTWNCFRFQDHYKIVLELHKIVNLQA
jgi:hypothetical protein